MFWSSSCLLLVPLSMSLPSAASLYSVGTGCTYLQDVGTLYIETTAWRELHQLAAHSERELRTNKLLVAGLACCRALMLRCVHGLLRLRGCSCVLCVCVCVCVCVFMCPAAHGRCCCCCSPACIGSVCWQLLPCCAVRVQAVPVLQRLVRMVSVKLHQFAAAPNKATFVFAECLMGQHGPAGPLSEGLLQLSCLPLLVPTRLCYNLWFIS